MHQMKSLRPYATGWPSYWIIGQPLGHVTSTDFTATSADFLTRSPLKVDALTRKFRNLRAGTSSHALISTCMRADLRASTAELESPILSGRPSSNVTEEPLASYWHRPDRQHRDYYWISDATISARKLGNSFRHNLATSRPTNAPAPVLITSPNNNEASANAGIKPIYLWTA